MTICNNNKKGLLTGAHILTLRPLMIIACHDSFSSCIHTSRHVCSDWHNGIRVRTKCLPIKEQEGENERDGLQLCPRRNECSALFGYAVGAEIDFCEKHAPKKPPRSDEINNTLLWRWEGMWKREQKVQNGIREEGKKTKMNEVKIILWVGHK